MGYRLKIIIYYISVLIYYPNVLDKVIKGLRAMLNNKIYIPFGKDSILCGYDVDGELLLTHIEDVLGRIIRLNSRIGVPSLKADMSVPFRVTVNSNGEVVLFGLRIGTITLGDVNSTLTEDKFFSMIVRDVTDVLRTALRNVPESISGMRSTIRFCIKVLSVKREVSLVKAFDLGRYALTHSNLMLEG